MTKKFFAITVLVIFLGIGAGLYISQKLPSFGVLACDPGECDGPGEYECQGGTMCCTGGGCPSWVCEQRSDPWEWCSSKPSNVNKGCCYLSGGATCAGGPSRYCTSLPGNTCSQCAGGGDGDGDGDGDGGGCNWDSKSNITEGTCEAENGGIDAAGLWGHYYRDFPVGDPRYDGGLKESRNDSQVNFNWSGAPASNMCEDNFAVSWTGYINLPSSGNWHWGIVSDDGMAVDIETSPGVWTRVVEDWWPEHATRGVWGGFYNLSSGWYGIRVWHYENGGGAHAELQMEGPGFAAQIVPNANLRACRKPPGTIQGRKVTLPSNTEVPPASTQTTYLDGGSPTPGTPYFYVNIPSGTRIVSISSPAGYNISSTLCYNRIDCHSVSCATGGVCPVPGARALGSSRIVDVPAGGYADLWWHFDPVVADPWIQADRGDIHSNNLIGFSRNPFSPNPIPTYNGQYLVSARTTLSNVKTGQGAGTAWRLPSYGEIPAPSYDDLFAQLGKNAFTYTDLPAAASLVNNRVYRITNAQTISSQYDVPANTNVLVFIDSSAVNSLTLTAQITTPSSSSITFMARNNIRIRKNLAGGDANTVAVAANLVAGGSINTSYNSSADTPQLAVGGSLISLSNTILFTRNLTDPRDLSEPAELIQPRPRFLILARSILGKPQIFWREVPAN